MKAEDLIRDPIFQLNLLIWAAKEQPATSAAVVTPVFSRRGFTLAYIENPFAFPVAIQQQIKELEDIAKAPNSDVIVANNTRRSAFYIEAKKDSFSPTSTNCRQARAHLIAAGPAFSEVYSPIKSCRLVYALPESCRPLMEPTLAALSSEVTTRGFSPGPYSVHGFDLAATHVAYVLDEASMSELEETAKVIPLLPLADDGETDPSPLLLIYTDCDTHNPSDRGFYRRILIHQVHAHLLSHLQHTKSNTVLSLKAEDVLMKTSGGAFQYVRGEPYKSMRVLVRDNIFKRIVKFWEEKKPDVFRLKGFELTVRFGDEVNKDEILDWLEDHGRTKFSDDPADPHEVATADVPQPIQSIMEFADPEPKPEPQNQ